MVQFFYILLFIREKLNKEIKKIINRKRKYLDNIAEILFQNNFAIYLQGIMKLFEKYNINEFDLIYNKGILIK